jgi:hypothetical protein
MLKRRNWVVASIYMACTISDCPIARESTSDALVRLPSKKQAMKVIMR